MHAKIVKAYKNYHLFGFTSAPIFTKNASKSKHLELLTTPQTFGNQLHSYTIVDAINDGNVLPFRIDYVYTVKKKDDIKDKDARAIDIERAMGAPERITEIVKYILAHFDQKTQRNSHYSLGGQRLAGFNSIFAVSSIPMAMEEPPSARWWGIYEQNEQEQLEPLSKDKDAPHYTFVGGAFFFLRWAISA